MNKKSFIMSCVLTGMDVLVFALCVDKGLTPVTLVGACYIALRLFGRDSQSAVALWEPAMEKFNLWVKAQEQKLQDRKEETPEE